MSVVTPKITDQLTDQRAPRSIVDELFRARNIGVSDLERLPSVVFSPGDGSGIPQDVELSVPGHSDATIYYTTNGLVPSIQNPPYSTALKIDRGTTILAVAIKTGYAPSPISSADYLEQGQLAPPTFSPGSGSVGPTSVTLSGPSGASIYYTTDGSTPTAETGTLYTGPVGVGGNQSIKAISVKSGSKTSVVASAFYVYGQLPDVVFSPEGGAVPTSVALSMPSHPLATIYYSTAVFDCGPGPQSAYQVYSSPITVESPSYVYAYATLAGYEDSDHKAVKYADTLPSVSFSTLTGGVLTPNSVSMSVSGFADGDVDVYYTTDGTDPTTSSTKYDAAYPPFFPSGEINLKAKAVKCGYSDGPVTSFSLVEEINIPAPAFTPASGSELPSAATSVSINVPGYPTANIYYTLDGSEPTTSDTLYSGPIDITSESYPLTIKAIGESDLQTGDVGTATYSQSQVAAPTFTPASGDAPIAVTMSTVTSGASIYYTLDGSTPTTSDTLYSSAVAVAETATLKAIAVKTGWTDSDVTEQYYATVDPVNAFAVKINDAYSEEFGTVDLRSGSFRSYAALDPNTSIRAMANMFTIGEFLGVRDVLAVSGAGTTGSVENMSLTLNDPAGDGQPTPHLTGTSLVSGGGSVGMRFDRVKGKWYGVFTEIPSNGSLSGPNVVGSSGQELTYTWQRGDLLGSTNISVQLPTIDHSLVDIDGDTGTLSGARTLSAGVTAIQESGSQVYAAVQTLGATQIHALDESTGSLTQLGIAVGPDGQYVACEDMAASATGTQIVGVFQKTPRTSNDFEMVHLPVTAQGGLGVERIAVSFEIWDGNNNRGAGFIGHASDVWNSVAKFNNDLVNTVGDFTGASIALSDTIREWGSRAPYGGGNPGGYTGVPQFMMTHATGSESFDITVNGVDGTYNVTVYREGASELPYDLLVNGASQGMIETTGLSHSGPGALSWFYGTTTNALHWTNVVIPSGGSLVVSASPVSEERIHGMHLQDATGNSAAIAGAYVQAAGVQGEFGKYYRAATKADGDVYAVADDNSIATVDTSFGVVSEISGSVEIRALTAIEGVSAVEFSPGDGSTFPTTVSLLSATVGATIYYTTNGADPKTDGVVYSSPISITTTRTIRAYATKNWKDSVETQASYVETAGQVSPVTFSPTSGEPITGSGLIVEMSTATVGADIYYSTDPSDTGDPDTLYTGPIVITSNTTFKAMATKSGMTNSAKTSATYGTLGSDEVEFFYLDSDSDRAGAWGNFGPGGSNDFHFAIYFNLPATTSVNRIFITIQPRQANITSATNTSPIVVTTEFHHGLNTGHYVHVYDCQGNEAANGEWQITKLSDSSFSLDGSTGDGVYTGGGKFAGGGGHTSDTAADGSQTWDTGISAWFPIVIFDEDDVQLNSAYGETFGPFSGLTRLDGYGDIVSIPGSHFTLWVVLSDGRTLLKTISF